MPARLELLGTIVIKARQATHQKRRTATTIISNGFVERMNRTLLDDCFRIGGRTKWCATPEELQDDLDTFLVFHNRSHQGYRLADRTLAAALFDGIGLRGLRLLPPAPEEALVAS